VNSDCYGEGSVDLSGWQIISRACTLTVDSGVVIPDTGVYIVLDSNNLSGKLHLFPDSDHVTIVAGAESIDQMSYPGPQTWGTCFSPPAGMSVAPHYYWTGQPGQEYLTRLWFVESLPTFGQPNPETAGSMSGRVFDGHGTGVPNAVVCMSGPEGSLTAVTLSDGSYGFGWLGPGTFQVTATKDSQTGAYPDSVYVSQDHSPDSVNVTIYSLGVAEKSRVEMDWRGNRLRVSLPEPALADLRTVNIAGRVCGRLHEMLAAGETELHPLSALPSGVYFIQGRIGKEPVNRKAVVFR
jgi:hypothetical protein